MSSENSSGYNVHNGRTDSKSIFSSGAGESGFRGDMEVITPEAEIEKGTSAMPVEGQHRGGVLDSDSVIDSVAQRNALERDGEEVERLVSHKMADKQKATRNMDYGRCEQVPEQFLGELDMNVDARWEDNGAHIRPFGMDLRTFVEAVSTVPTIVGSESETYDERAQAYRRVLSETQRHPRGSHGEARVESGSRPDIDEGGFADGEQKAAYAWSEAEAEAAFASSSSPDAIPDTPEFGADRDETMQNRRAIVGSKEANARSIHELERKAGDTTNEFLETPAFAEWFPSVNEIRQETLSLLGEDTRWVDAVEAPDYDQQQVFEGARHKAFEAYNELPEEEQEALEDAGQSLYDRWEDEWADILGFRPSPIGFAALLADRGARGDDARDAAFTLMQDIERESHKRIIGGHGWWKTLPFMDMTVDVEGTVVQVFDNPNHKRQAQAGLIVDDYGRLAKWTVWKDHDDDRSPDWAFKGMGLNGHETAQCRHVSEGDRVLLENFSVRTYNDKTILESTRRDKWNKSRLVRLEHGDGDCSTGYGPSKEIGEPATATCEDDDGPESEVPGQIHAVRSRGWVERQLPDNLAYRVDSDRFTPVAEAIAFQKACKWIFPRESVPEWFIEQENTEVVSQDDCLTGESLEN